MVWFIWKRFIFVIFLSFLYWIFISYQLREEYIKLNLEPRGSGSVVKDLTALSLVSIPKIVRFFTTGSVGFDYSSRKSLLEGFHTTATTDFISPNGAMPSKMLDSPYFAENFYFWLNDPNKNDFVVTTRLSFYGKNASRVIPWFTFQLHGEEWNLPDDFQPNKHHFGKDPRIAQDPLQGTLLFENPEPMKEWRITYKGLVQSKSTGIKLQVDCEFLLTFNEKDVFFYQIHWDEMSTALSLAAKPWSAQVFKNLREQNQERYASKALSARGHVTFVKESKTEKFSTLQGSRDHLWGIRNWLFMYRYIWWPPTTLKSPLVINGVKYTSFIGAFVEYGNTFKNMVVGGLMSEDGSCASFSGATGMHEIAKEWYDIRSKRKDYIGEKHLPRRFKFEIAILQAEYILDVELDRGKPAGLWSHSFDLADGDFEIHEALTLFKFSVRKTGDPTKVSLSATTASGLFEFGGNLLGVTDSQQ
jgi:hypothetical protein